jgi:hypothetical protein
VTSSTVLVILITLSMPCSQENSSQSLMHGTWTFCITYLHAHGVLSLSLNLSVSSAACGRC